MNRNEESGLLSDELRKRIQNCQDDQEMHKLLKLADAELDDDVLDLVTGGTQYETTEETVKNLIGNDGIEINIQDIINKLNNN